jgi:hypothetical protein
MEKLKENLLDLTIYFIGTFLLLIPFFKGVWDKHICLSVLVSFGFGMGNRIIRELYDLKIKNGE